MIPLRDNINSRTYPFICHALIFINVIVFVHQWGLQKTNALEPFIYAYALVPRILLADPTGHALNLVTSQFLHGSWMHLIGNMLYLYIFGDNVEDRLGHLGFILFYLFAGIGAGLAQTFFHLNSVLPMVGASGAIAGILGAYFIFHPGARVLTLIPFGFFSRIIEIPAFFFLGFWFLMQTFSGTAALYTARTLGRDIGGVAWWAHAGGFAVGLIIGSLARIRQTVRRW